MTETIVRCDRCKKAIERDRTKLDVATGQDRMRTATVDLCPSCVDSLLVFLDAGEVTTSDR